NQHTQLVTRHSPLIRYNVPSIDGATPMSLNLGIIGLPKSGKTTLFNALTGSHAQTSSYSSGEEPNVAVVKVPDPRLDVLTAMFHPRKTTPADVKFTDVVGMSGKADDKKEPISRQTLGFISTVDA